MIQLHRVLPAFLCALLAANFGCSASDPSPGSDDPTGAGGSEQGGDNSVGASGSATSSGGSSTGGGNTTSGSGGSAQVGSGGSGTGGTNAAGAGGSGGKGGAGGSGPLPVDPCIAANTCPAGTWVNVTPPDAKKLDFGTGPIVGDPSRPSDFYMGGGGEGVWKSTDYGNTWKKINDTVGYVPMGYVMTVLPGTPPTVIVAGYKVNHKSIDGGVTYQGHPLQLPRFALLDSDRSQQPEAPHQRLARGRRHRGVDRRRRHLELRRQGRFPERRQILVRLLRRHRRRCHHAHHLVRHRARRWQRGDDVELRHPVDDPHRIEWAWPPARQLADLSARKYDVGARRRRPRRRPLQEHRLGQELHQGSQWRARNRVVHDQERLHDVGMGVLEVRSRSKLPSCALPAGTAFTKPAVPAGLNIGANHIVVTSDGKHNIFVGTMWAAGVWRYVEP